MLTFKLPANNQLERKYSVEILVGEILELPFNIQYHDENFTRIELENGCELIFEDHFFGYYKNNSSYLQAKALPSQICWVHKSQNRFLAEDDLPIIFGNNDLHVNKNEIRCGADIFASSFLMLTRWEEFVLPIRDIHERFPANASIAVHNSFLHRPIVNEYAEMLWNMLGHFNCSSIRRQKKFEVVITHDVDFPLLWSSFGFFLKKVLGDIFKRHSMPELAFSIKSFFFTLLKIKKDPYDTFDVLMTLSERYGLKSHFFFLSEGEAKLDASFSLKSTFIRKLIGEIQKRGHVIGFHSGYDTSNDNRKFKKQLSKLNELVGSPITCGRQHFLRFTSPITWQIWEDQGLQWESSLGYPEVNGFRCGTCSPFSVFNFLTQTKLKLKEYPLTAMDATWAVYQKNKTEEVLNDADILLDKVQKYGGVFVLLWHNSSFNVPDWQKYEGVYEKLLSKISVLSKTPNAR